MIARRVAALGAVLVAACTSAARRSVSPSPLAAAESVYEELRFAKDQIDVTQARGAVVSARGDSLGTLARRYEAARTREVALLSHFDNTPLSGDDARALATMRAALADALPPQPLDTEGATTPAPGECRYDARALAAGAGGAERLRHRTYACYGQAARNVWLDGQHLDRLTVLGTLASTDDPARRRRLFLALDSMWRTMNADDGPESPYRVLVALDAPAWARGASPVDANARALGIEPAVLERWLVAILETWRRSTPDSLIEPWDYHWMAGAASRRLDAHVPLADYPRIVREVYRSLGADVDSLHVHFDLAPRDGKTPVAFTAFGARHRLRNGAELPTEPWIFATYRVGGLDNLNELLHETGHAVHIAAIRTRPAFLDWPDSDPLTEGIADIVALDVYEPAWQQRWLGDSVPLADGVRGRYGAIVLDVAWALFDLRMHQHPGADPNAVWSAITSTYLHVRPHPELSWWAMRGQLVDLPGYMMNYALGAIVVADVRARIRAVHGDFTSGDSTWYAWMSAHIYRWGLERPSARVLREVLGRGVTPDALLNDMARARQR